MRSVVYRRILICSLLGALSLPFNAAAFNAAAETTKSATSRHTCLAATNPTPAAPVVSASFCWQATARNNEQVTINAQIRNISGRRVRGVLVVLDPKPSDGVEIDSLRPGKSRQVGLRYTLPAAVGGSSQVAFDAYVFLQNGNTGSGLFEGRRLLGVAVVTIASPTGP